MLNRSLFLLFAGGFSCSVLLSKLIVLWVDKNKQTMNVVLYISWFSYLLIQIPFYWAQLEEGGYEMPDFMLSISTLFYNVSICSILYMSIERILVLYPAGKIQKYTRLAMYPLLIVLFVIRTARSVIVFLQNTGLVLSTETNILHAVTLFPILILRNFYDILALKAVVNMKRMAVQVRGEPRLNYDSNRALKTLVLNLSVEIFLSVFSLGVATVEAFMYRGNMVAYVDWILISWALGGAIEQKQIYRAIFRARTSSEIDHDEIVEQEIDYAKDARKFMFRL